MPTTKPKRIFITDTTLRDAHQSLLATRLRTEDMLPIASKLDEVGFWSIEMWGGACVRMFASGGVSTVARTDAMSHNAAVQRIDAGSPLRSLRAHKEGGRRKRLIDKNRTCS